MSRLFATDGGNYSSVGTNKSVMGRESNEKFNIAGKENEENAKLFQSPMIKKSYSIRSEVLLHLEIDTRGQM